MPRFVFVLPGLLLLLLLSMATSAPAQESDSVEGIADGDYQSAVVLNADTGDILYEKNAHQAHGPASMVKMMLMLLVMEKLETKSIRLSDPVVTSARASKFGGSQVYLKEGEVFTLEEMMQAITIHSANDASVAVAEFLTGSVESCVDLMNRRARELGMHDTRFQSVDGLPPSRKQEPDLSSPYDMALVARQLVRYPRILEWASTKSAPFRDGKFTLTNTNKLIGKFPGADGLKTGYYRKAGYNLAATASRDGLRLISVVMGAPTNRVRVNESARLLGIGFNLYKKVHVVKKGEPFGEGIPVSGGTAKRVPVTAAEDLFIQVRRGEESSIETVLDFEERIEAPINAGAPCGTILVRRGDEEVGRVDALAVEAVPEADLFQKLVSRILEVSADW
ncbi:MAG: D-alanyl-D-alanine carboxypeptidase family protein [bacterium]|nr:D-alanyl-D-alanine carboxypeptidase family protein [bacterium]